jgi:L-ascorbate metabolism protein UlaG (beta-lactamase superfamily)
MKITKFTHSCLFVETSVQGEHRTALFDPGVYSTYKESSFSSLDDILITHKHPDHMDIERIRRLRLDFPRVTITAPIDAKEMLLTAGIADIRTTPSRGIRFFDAPHESIKPLVDSDVPDELGVHYLDVLSDPGDSHSFHETMPVLALPICAPWGSTVQAVRIALELQPKYIIPTHDWHWHDQAREEMYDRLEKRFAAKGIIFLSLKNGEPQDLNI